MFKLNPIDNSPTVIEIAELLSKSDKNKLIDNAPTFKHIQKALSDQAIKLAEMKAKGEKPLEIVDYIDICSPFGIPDTSINRGYAHLRNFVEGNPIRINLETPSLETDNNFFVIKKQEDKSDHNLQLTIQKKRTKPSSLLLKLIGEL